MIRQLTFDLPAKAALGRDDFFVSPANQHAVEVLEDWTNWSGGKQIVAGPAASGKTHLAHVWAADCDGRVVSAGDIGRLDIAALLDQCTFIAIEDIDYLAGNADGERALFHLHNAILAADGRLLLTTATAPGAITFALPDLASRVQATNVVKLHPADDPLMAAILVKLFADRQLDVHPNVIRYLVTHTDRAFDDLPELVSALDARALSERRPITVPLVRSVLDIGG